jgi:hypothetical protein
MTDGISPYSLWESKGNNYLNIPFRLLFLRTLKKQKREGRTSERRKEIEREGAVIERISVRMSISSLIISSIISNSNLCISVHTSMIKYIVCILWNDSIEKVAYYNGEDINRHKRDKTKTANLLTASKIKTVERTKS